MAECVGQCVFGPVPSRRLGRSLGVDLVPFKTCSYDCVYCQLGPTTDRTIARRAWVPLERAVSEVEARLGLEPDCITLSGSGEPTLYEPLGELIASIKAVTPLPVVVLTNGSLLWDPDVRRGLARADVVVPSLDAATAEVFQKVNRPDEAVLFDTMIEGLCALRGAFEGTIWLEVFFVAGLNDDEAHVAGLARLAERIQPDRVHLNTVARPPAEAWVEAVPEERMASIAQVFGPKAEVIGAPSLSSEGGDIKARCEDVANLLARRPCTVGQIAAALRLHRNEVAKYIHRLSVEGRLGEDRHGGEPYYRVVRSPRGRNA